MKNITFIQDNTPAKFIRNRSCNFREEDRQVKSLQTDRQWIDNDNAAHDDFTILHKRG